MQVPMTSPIAYRPEPSNRSTRLAVHMPARSALEGGSSRAADLDAAGVK